jgi:hypothetical protein
MIARVARDTTLACLALAILFLLFKRNIAAPLGVIGGGLLIGGRSGQSGARLTRSSSFDPGAKRAGFPWFSC